MKKVSYICISKWKKNRLAKENYPKEFYGLDFLKSQFGLLMLLNLVKITT